jgi:hypothetical protein
MLGDPAFAQEGVRPDDCAIMVAIAGQIFNFDLGVLECIAQQRFERLDGHSHGQLLLPSQGGLGQPNMAEFTAIGEQMTFTKVLVARWRALRASASVRAKGGDKGSLTAWETLTTTPFPKI